MILSGGSAGGLATFYNLDHLATLLPAGVKLTGAPDAGHIALITLITLDNAYNNPNNMSLIVNNIIDS